METLPPLTVHIPLCIVGKIRSIAKDGINPAVAFTADHQKMLENAYRVRGEALERIEKLIGLVPDRGVTTALQQWENI